MDDFQIIFCTCPDFDTAKSIAEAIIRGNKAACVNILPGITSVYQWKNEIETAQEHLLLIKTRQDHYQEIELLIKQMHPYELPEIISVPIGNGLPEYLNWINQCVS